MARASSGVWGPRGRAPSGGGLGLPVDRLDDLAQGAGAAPRGALDGEAGKATIRWIVGPPNRLAAGVAGEVEQRRLALSRAPA